MTSAKDTEAGVEQELRSAVHNTVKEYYSFKHAAKPFVPGVTYIPPSGKVFDEDELIHLVDSSLDFWLTAGRFAEAFERQFASRLGLAHTLLTNSGSSANLLAVSALTSPKLGKRKLQPGDEVITTAAAFPTTVNPIIQNNAVPVFVDVQIPTYNAVVEQIESAVTSKTRAIILAHTLGNPFDLAEVLAVAKKHDLWLVEDACDALGARYDGKPVSTFGDLATFSFYPAHHITMGEGGAVVTGSARLAKIVESFRDWGRDCWCAPGVDNTCGRRFMWSLGDLPAGYDHKYTYSHLGYNLKVTESQAAVGVAQLKKLDGFIAARRRNFDALKKGLSAYEEYLILPEATPLSEPSWFGFPLSVRAGAPFKRETLTAFLEEHRIGTRLLFAGDITLQPYFKDINHRRAGNLTSTGRVMRDAFWIGVHPGLTNNMIDYIVQQFDAFLKDP